MQDYMKALQDRFDSPSSGDSNMNAEVNLLFHELCSKLEPPECKQLIRLVDVLDALRDNTALSSFISGFKLAWGISRELSDDSPYSFEQEQEEHARKIFFENMPQEQF